MLHFTLLFFFSRVVRLFRANQQKKASLSLVKITEEFKMQVAKTGKVNIIVQATKFILYIRNPSLRNPEKRLQTLFPFFSPLLPRPHHPPPPHPKRKKTSVLARRVESPGLFNRQHLTTLKVLSKVSCMLCFTLTWLSYQGRRTIQGCINMIITNAFNSATSYLYYWFNFWQKTIVAILDCLISPRWPHPPCLASDTVPCLSWRNLQDTPTHFHVTYDILESDANGRCPDEPGYKYTPRSCYYNLAKYCNRTLNKVIVLTTLGRKS